ncbi:MAG TPA: DUF1501 domain-containing protein [Candidatus Binataceae bacterium]|nr:DUF1501 domain-containing protein [Candidatus Binataceae bacterium]
MTTKSNEMPNKPLAVSIGRRDFIRAAGIASVTAGIILLAPHAWAMRTPADASKRKRLVVLFLRGAVDGLNVVAPYGDHEYYEARPTIALPRQGDGAIINLDGHFGLNPALASVMPLWRDGTLAFVQACGSPDPTRSHFDAQDYMESGTPGNKSTPDGWMNRLVASFGEHAPTTAVSVGPTVPRILSGRMAVANIAAGRGAARPLPLDNPKIEEAFDRMYSGRDALSVAYQEGRTARKQLLGKLQQDMTEANNGAPTPDGFAQDAARLAHLMREDAAIRVVFMALGGWDTHVNQGAARGQLTKHLGQLGDGLASFAKELGPAFGDTVILVISEFGRTLHENGDAGTDHGHGNVMWLMGGPIRGGKVYGRWPGLATAQLYQGRDLAVTTDFREPIASVLQEHLGLTTAQCAAVLPNHPPNSAAMRLIRA